MSRTTVLTRTIPILKAHSFDGELITIVVGAGLKSAIFFVHEKIICLSSEYINLEKELRSYRQQSQTFELPNFTPNLFRVYLHWLYTGHLGGAFDRRLDDRSSDGKFKELSKAFLLGAKLQDQRFKTQIRATMTNSYCESSVLLATPSEEPCDESICFSAESSASPLLSSPLESNDGERDGNPDKHASTQNGSNRVALAHQRSPSDHSTEDAAPVEAEPETGYPRIFSSSPSARIDQESAPCSGGVLSTIFSKALDQNLSTSRSPIKKGLPLSMVLVQKKREYEESLQGREKRQRTSNGASELPHLSVFSYE